jgi:hypothetical protein
VKWLILLGQFFGSMVLGSIAPPLFPQMLPMRDSCDAAVVIACLQF